MSMVVYKPERNRTAQGEARIASLLAAAERVFGKIGYHAATTNAIAKEASVSPATFYQFFPNKESIADALALTYAEKLAETHRMVGLVTLDNVDTETLVSRLVDPLVEFHQRYPAFRTLLLEAPAGGAMERKHELTAINNAAVADLFRTRNRKLTEEQALLASQSVLAVFVGFLPLIAVNTGKKREDYIGALKGVLVSFLKSIV